MKARSNYKKLYGITLKEAKERAKEILGRLPHCGMEVCVKTDMVDVQSIDGTFYYTNCKRYIYLVNRSGSFYLYQYTSISNTYR